MNRQKAETEYDDKGEHSDGDLFPRLHLECCCGDGDSGGSNVDQADE